MHKKQSVFKAENEPAAFFLPTALCLGCFLLPVRSQPGGDISSGDLRHDVAPEKRSVDQPHRLWIPVELGFLGSKTQNAVSKYLL